METNNHRRNTRFLSGSLWDFSSHIITYLSQVLSLSLFLPSIYSMYLYLCMFFFYDCSLSGTTATKRFANRIPTASRYVLPIFVKFSLFFSFAYLRCKTSDAEESCRQGKPPNGYPDVESLFCVFVRCYSIVRFSIHLASAPFPNAARLKRVVTLWVD